MDRAELRQRHEARRAARGDGQITIRLPANLLKTLDRLADERLVSRVEVIRRLIATADSMAIEDAMRRYGLSRSEAQSFLESAP